VTIYTDLSYAFGVVHKFGALWSEQGFITSTGAPVKNGQWIANLLQAIIWPFQNAVIKYDTHTGGSDDVSRRNAGADKATKATAISQDALLVSQCALTPAATTPSLDDVTALQAAVSSAERDLWVMSGCEFDGESKLWKSPDNRVVALKALLPWLARLGHGAGHSSKGGNVFLYWEVMIFPWL